MRHDIHSPENFDPAAYTYVGSFNNWPEPGAFVSPTYANYDTDFGTVHALNYEHAEYKGGRDLLRDHGVKIHFDVEQGTSQCDHCGARIRYVSIFRHNNGELIAVGDTCAEERFGCDSRRTFDIQRLQKHAKDARERAKCFGRANDWVQATCPEMTDWLLSPAARTVHEIFADMAGKLIRFGSLSEKQLNFARKLLREHFERQRNGGKTDEQIRRDEEKAKAEDCPIGRVTIKGEVIKTELRETSFGETLKMVVKAEQGFLAWGTVPDSLAIVEDKKGGFQRGLERGDKIELTATFERSEKDPKFGFYKRPRAKLIEA